MCARTDSLDTPVCQRTITTVSGWPALAHCHFSSVLKHTGEGGGWNPAWVWESEVPGCQGCGLLRVHPSCLLHNSPAVLTTWCWRHPVLGSVAPCCRSLQRLWSRVSALVVWASHSGCTPRFTSQAGGATISRAASRLHVPALLQPPHGPDADRLNLHLEL